MPPKTGGKKSRKLKTGSSEPSKKEIPFADPDKGVVYGIAVKILGGPRLTVRCADRERLAIIPGAFKGRKNWIVSGALLLLNIAEYFSDDKAYVMHIYDAQSAKFLERNGELKELIKDDQEDESAGGFTFGHVEKDNDSDDEDSPNKRPNIAPQPTVYDLDDL